jgi:two-component system chemotaxis sensor kinase CheA
VSDPHPDNGGDFFAQFLDDYFAECDEHLTLVRRNLLALEEQAGRTDVDPALLDELFRSFHTLKGISAMVDLGEAEQLAHHMESYLRALRQKEARPGVEGVETLMAATIVRYTRNPRRRRGSRPHRQVTRATRIRSPGRVRPGRPAPQVAQIARAPGGLSSSRRPPSPHAASTSTASAPACKSWERFCKPRRTSGGRAASSSSSSSPPSLTKRHSPNGTEIT